MSARQSQPMSSTISHTVLIVAEPLTELSAERAAGALADGLQSGGRTLSIDALTVKDAPSGSREWWATPEHAERLRAARAVVIVAARLDERTLTGSVAFEVATSARQAGVPAYAIAARNALDLFDARMLDLQTVIEARTPPALAAAGRKLAGMV